MGAKSKIEWTDSTWNPIRGCSRVSEGCRHCYAESVAYRFSGPGLPYEGLAVLQNGHASWTGKIEFVEKHLLDPLKWSSIVEHVEGCAFSDRKTTRGQMCFCPRRPRRIFVNSMSDLFHENVTDEMRDKIFAVMALCPQHIFQVLTKRPDRMLAYVSNARARINELAFVNALRGYGKINPETLRGAGSLYWPLKQVWLGVSVENQTAADERIPLLLQTPAAVRFISAEPLLGSIDFRRRCPVRCDGECGYPSPFELLGAVLPGSPLIDWVICGGESGPGARRMEVEWARSLRDQCACAGVPFFFKQWGGWVPTTDPKIAEARGVPFETCMDYVGKNSVGAHLDGVEWKQFPTV
jgi:protein gp37